jgi:hypothetical protein
MNSLEKMLLGGDRAAEWLGVGRKTDEDIRRDFAIGLLSLRDALRLLGYEGVELSDTEGRQGHRLDTEQPFNPLPQSIQLPYFWSGGELPETTGNIYAINHASGGVLAIGHTSEKQAIASFEAEFNLEIESSANVTDLLNERIDEFNLDASLKNVRGNLCRDARGRFVSCGTPTTKVESSLSKKRRQVKEQRDRDLQSALQKTDFSDYKQVEKLGQLYSKQYIKSTSPTPKERELFKKNNAIAEAKLGNFDWMDKASRKDMDDAISEFQSAEKEYLTQVERRQTRLTSQYQQLRDAIVKHHGMAKKDAEALTSLTKYEQSLGSYSKSVKSYHKEFLQLTGGKSITSIETIGKNEARAYAIASIGYINVGSKAKKETFYHEAAHHMEFESPKLKQAANDWMRSKATSNNPKKLSELTGIKAYSKDEVALPDKFADPYVGKIYKDGSTEVLSMGIEHFVSAKSMNQLREKDKRHFDFTVGVLLAQ